ncbi:hypothetical protein ACQEWB_50200 [Streptomyces sp. CA-249302]
MATLVAVFIGADPSSGALLAPDRATEVPPSAREHWWSPVSWTPAASR